MATIALGTGALTYSFSNGINAFSGLNNTYTYAKKASSNLVTELASLKITIDIACESVHVEGAVTQIQQARSREDVKSGSLTVGYEKLDSYIKDVGETDQTVSFVVSGSKRDFYKEYYYLKPECEKSRGEKIDDFFASVGEILGDIWTATKDFFKNIGAWIEEHWQLLLAAVVIIVVVAVITVFTGGAGAALVAGAIGKAIAWAIVKGLATAILTGFISGAINAGVASYQCRKNNIPKEYARQYISQAFGDGMASGILMGAIGYGVGAMVNLGASTLLTRVPKIGEFFVAKTLGQAIGKGALYGAITSGTTGTVTSAIGYFVQNGTDGSFKGFIKTVLIGGGLSTAFGAITGGFGGARQFLKTQKMDTAFTNENLDRTARGEQNKLKSKDGINQGDNYENYASMRQSTTKPGLEGERQVRVENPDYAAQQKAAGARGQTARADEVLRQPNGDIDSIWEYKSSDKAPFTKGQQNYGISDGALSRDALVGGQSMPEGTLVHRVFPQNFTREIGVNVARTASPAYTQFEFESKGVISSSNFLDVLSQIKTGEMMISTHFSLTPTVISTGVVAAEREEKDGN